MKTVHIIEDEIKLDITVLAINSYVKGQPVLAYK